MSSYFSETGQISIKLIQQKESNTQRVHEWVIMMIFWLEKNPFI